MIRVLSAAALAVLLTAGSAHAATLIVDGNFANAFSTFGRYGSGQVLGSAFGPWTVTSGTVDLIGGYWQEPSPGSGSVDLAGTGPGSIAQTFSAPAGQYVLDFVLSGNPDGLPTTKSLQVSVGGTTQNFTYTLGVSNSLANMLYIPESVAFTSPGGNLTVSFLSLDTGSPFSAVIGDVSTASTPLPPALLLFVSGLAGLFFFARRRAARA